MARFEVWSEGWAATGGSGGAHLHGVVEASSFEEACDKLLGGDEFYRRGDDGSLRYWSCRLFDNEKDARKSYG